MTGDQNKRATEGEQPSKRARWLRVETALAVAGALITGSFALPWFETPEGGGLVSGLDLALRGGLWSGLLAIPALGALTALLGFLGWRAARYAGLATAFALLIPAAVVLSGQWPWLYTVPLAAGVAVIALGLFGRGLRASPALGVVLLGLAGVAVWLSGGEPLLPDRDHGGGLFGLPLPAAIPLLALSVAAVLSGIALVITGLRKKGRERALVIAGSSIVGLSAYAAALDEHGIALATSGVGVWMTSFGGAVLLLLSRPLASRAAAAAKQSSKKDVAAAAATDKPSVAVKAARPDKPAAATPPAAEDDRAAKLAKLEKLKKLKRLKELKELEARERAAAEEAKAAEAEEVATAKAGEALASEPEPSFASDPGAPPPPENEDRDALMRRMGVKKPAPPSDSELDAMLAALKSRTGDD